jgi:predicted RNA-binding protein with PUA-like domain
MAYWLMKSEPSEASIDDVLAKPNQTVPWYGVRNYQARNFMMCDMRLHDGVLFYHSSCPEPGIAGIGEVARLAYPDATQFDPDSPYYDAKATRDNPRWFNVDVKISKKIALIPLADLRNYPELQQMKLLARGNRLSITPVSRQEWDFIQGLCKPVSRRKAS